MAVWQWDAINRRRWKPRQKSLIVPEGLKGRPVGELSVEHETAHQRRGQFLANAAKAFELATVPPMHFFAIGVPVAIFWFVGPLSDLLSRFTGRPSVTLAV